MVIIFKSCCKWSWIKFSLSIRSIFKGGYLDFLTLTELKNIIIINEIYMKKQYKSSITSNHEISRKTFLDGISFKGYVAS